MYLEWDDIDSRDGVTAQKFVTTDLLLELYNNLLTIPTGDWS